MLELYIKYLLEGIAVAVAAYFIPRKKVNITEIIFIALSAAATFALLDIFAPKVGSSARTGAGFGIGANVVGWPAGAGVERFENDSVSESSNSKSESTESSTEGFESKESSKDTKSTDSTVSTASTASTASSEPVVAKADEVQAFDTTQKYSQF